MNNFGDLLENGEKLLGTVGGKIENQTEILTLVPAMWNFVLAESYWNRWTKADLDATQYIELIRVLHCVLMLVKTTVEIVFCVDRYHLNLPKSKACTFAVSSTRNSSVNSYSLWSHACEN